MKVYVATRGQFNIQRIQHIFANREDAEAYAGADEVTEWDVMDHPIEQDQWHEIIWSAHIGDREADSTHMANPYQTAWPKDYISEGGYVTHHWASRGTEVVLCVQGWELDGVLKVYSEQRAKYLAGQEV